MGGGAFSANVSKHHILVILASSFTQHGGLYTALWGLWSNVLCSQFPLKTTYFLLLQSLATQRASYGKWLGNRLQLYMSKLNLFLKLFICPSSSPGVSSRAEKERWIFCSKSSEERRGADGWWCWVHHGREEGFVSSLGKSLPYTSLLHLPN